MINAKKKRNAVISSIAAFLFIAPLVVFAVIYSSRQRTNQFAPADANVQIEEEGTSADTQTQTYVFPAAADADGNHGVDKIALVGEDDNPNGEFLRVRFVPMWYDADGNVCAGIDGVTNISEIRLQNNLLLFCKGDTDADVVIKLHLTDNWQESWTYKDDGVFESSVPVKSGKAKREILKKVELPTAVYSAAKTAGLELHVDVLADAIQTVGESTTAPRWNDTP